jgi:hypothetical protein
MQRFILWMLNKRVGWGNTITKPFDIWLYKFLK